MRLLSLYIAGCLFSTGLIISGMVNPAKVQAFLDVTGNWDFSLAWVMVGAIITTSMGYRWVFKRQVPAYRPQFSLPTKTDIDSKLIIGAGLFGVGWGLSGLCPGPALTIIGFAPLKVAGFIIAMLLGMIMARRLQNSSN